MSDCIEIHGCGKRPKATLDGERLPMARVLYIVAYGHIDDGLQVLHSCDNKLCINLDHLHLGTHDDNMREGKERNRFKKGNQLKHAKLDADRVRLIRQLLAEGESQQHIAELLGISQVAVSKIKRRVSWGHVI